MNKHLLGLLITLKGLANGPDFDIVLKCRDDEVGAHSLILKARSDVFRTMLSSDFADSGAKTIDLSKYSVKSVTTFKTYIYTAWGHGIGRGHSVQEMFELYELADMYMFDEFKETIQSYIVSAAK
jgi:hypothetical protein